MALGGNGISYLVRDANTGTAGSKYDHANVAELLSADIEGGHDGGQRDATGTLNVVIEAGHTWAIYIQQSPS